MRDVALFLLFLVLLSSSEQAVAHGDKSTVFHENECSKPLLDYTRISLKMYQYLNENDYCLEWSYRQNQECKNYTEKRKQAVAYIEDLAKKANSICAREVAIADCILPPWPVNRPDAVDKENMQRIEGVMRSLRRKLPEYPEILRQARVNDDKFTSLSYRCARLKIAREQYVIDRGR